VKSLIYIKRRGKKGVEEVILSQKWSKIIPLWWTKNKKNSEKKKKKLSKTRADSCRYPYKYNNFLLKII
jgi:hypothetical protein